MKIEAMNEAINVEAKPMEAWGRALAVVHRLLQLNRRRSRRLRLCESLPLGDRRFVAVVEFDRSRFLVGGTAGSLGLLARLEDSDDESPRDKRDGAVEGSR